MDTNYILELIKNLLPPEDIFMALNPTSEAMVEAFEEELIVLINKGDFNLLTLAEVDPFNPEKEEDY